MERLRFNRRMNTNLKTGLVYSETYLQHVNPPGHPESTRRAEVVMKGLEEAEVLPKLERIQPRPAERGDVLRCHSAEYYEIAKRDVERGLSDLSTGDTNICARSFDV